MDFEKPLSEMEGYVIYATFMEYMKIFLSEYRDKHNGEQYPPLRTTTDMILTLFSDIKKIDLSNLPVDFSGGGDGFTEIINAFDKELSHNREESEGIVSSEEAGLFLGVGEAYYVYVRKNKEYNSLPDEPPANTSMKTTSFDTDFLKGMGIKFQEKYKVREKTLLCPTCKMEIDIAELTMIEQAEALNGEYIHPECKQLESIGDKDAKSK